MFLQNIQFSLRPALSFPRVRSDGLGARGGP